MFELFLVLAEGKFGCLFYALGYFQCHPKHSGDGFESNIDK